MKLQDIAINENMSQHAPSGETARLVAHWKEHGKGMSEAELADAIGNDLEQLEYSPDEIAHLVPQIVSQVIGG